jgi:hypothetical protein
MRAFHGTDRGKWGSLKLIFHRARRRTVAVSSRGMGIQEGFIRHDVKVLNVWRGAEIGTRLREARNGLLPTWATVHDG